MRETKHNKELCRNCKYRGTIGSRTNESTTNIVCDYSATSGEHRTCLTVVHGEVIDRRGDDYDVCLLREEGEQIGRARNAEIPPEKFIHVTIGGKHGSCKA